VIGQELLRVLATLADALAIEREPRAALVDDVRLGREIDEIAFARDALSINDVELGLRREAPACSSRP
jgi:hypothetical protein